MSDSWMNISDVEEESDTEPKSAQEFTGQIKTMLANSDVERLAVSLLDDRVPEVEDAEVLEMALEAEGREEAQSIYQDRLSELDELDTGSEAESGDEDPDLAVEKETKEADETVERDEKETDDSVENVVRDEGDNADAEPEGVEADEEVEEGGPEGIDGSEQVKVNASESDEEAVNSPFGDSDGGSDDDEEDVAESDGSDDENANMDTEETVEPETPNAPSNADPDPAETDGGPEVESADNIDVKSIAPDVMTANEAAQQDRRFTMLVWSDPGMGKTHFACSSPDPTVIIDTEGKADEVARKFRGQGRVDESPFIFQPTDYDEAMSALDSALKILDEYRNKADMIGTLVVDSMSVMWGWSQQKYVEKFYPGKDAEEVEFSSAIGGGNSDWKQIKRYHNVKFRQVMLDSPYHLVWTAMREDDYEERMKGNRDADKPSGEKENPYKVDEVLRIQEGSDGAPVGVLNKSGKIKHRYAGLRYPTFDKHRETIDDILDAERGDRSVESVAGKLGIRVHEGNPEYEEDDD